MFLSTNTLTQRKVHWCQLTLSRANKSQNVVQIGDTYLLLILLTLYFDEIL